MLQAARSQLEYARLVRPLWEVGDLARLARVPMRWLRGDGRAPPPLAVNWYLTWACQERCDFCEVEGAGYKGSKRLSASDRERLVDQLFPACRILGVAGGEPLLAPDAIPLLERAARRGARVFVATNGVLMKTEKGRALADLGAAVVNVSIVGDEASHDAQFRREGAFRDAVDGIANLLAWRDPRRTRVCINCTVTLDNVHVLESVAALGRRLGVDHVRFTWLSFLTPGEHVGAESPTCLKLPAERLSGFDAPGLVDEVERVERLYPGFVTFQPRLTREERLAWYREGGGVYRTCLPIWHTLYLRPDGQGVGCGHFLDEPLGPVLDRDLDEVWNHPRMRALRLAERRSSACMRCCKV